MNNEKLRSAAELDAADWDKVVSRAEALMASHKFGCSEALLLAFQETLGEEMLPRAAVSMASAFRGGLGGSGCLCGALAAGEMVLGSVFGYEGDANGVQDPEAVKKSRLLFKELHDRFRERFKASCCRVLTKGMDHASPERKTQCTNLVKMTSALTSGIIAREVLVLAARATPNPLR